MSINNNTIKLFGKLEDQNRAITFDEITIEDKPSEIHPNDIIVKTKLTKNITLNIPIISSCMDTVTGGDMALAMAKNGGVGIIHRNMSTDEQVNIIKWVRNKIHNGGMIEKPITFSVSHKVSDIHNSIKANGWSFTNFPILDKDKLVGMVSRNELEFVEDDDPFLTDIMIPLERLVVADKHETDIYNIMKKNKVKKLPVIDNNNVFVGMYTWNDITKDNKSKSCYSLDNSGRFLVGAAIGVGDMEKNRVKLLANADCRLLVIDTSHGACKAVKDMLYFIKDNYPIIDVIVGNVASYDSTMYLLSGKYVPDAIRCGISVGSICTTRRVTGHGMPQLTAIYNVWKALYTMNMTDIPIIADGGIRYSGDIVKALSVGASTVMLGSVLAGTDESPGNIVISNGHKYKMVRGMGSRSAMEQRDGQGSRGRYFSNNNNIQLTINQKKKIVPEGIEGLTKYRGSVNSVLYNLVGGIKVGLGHSGAKDITEFRETVKIWIQSTAGIIEAEPHDLHKIIDN